MRCGCASAGCCVKASAIVPLETLAARALTRDPAQRAIEFEGRWYYWGEVIAVARELQRLLAASGAPADVPVGFVGRNHPAALAALLALIAERRTIRSG